MGCGTSAGYVCRRKKSRPSSSSSSCVLGAAKKGPLARSCENQRGVQTLACSSTGVLSSNRYTSETDSYRSSCRHEHQKCFEKPRGVGSPAELPHLGAGDPNLLEFCNVSHRKRCLNLSCPWSDKDFVDSGKKLHEAYVYEMHSVIDCGSPERSESVCRYQHIDADMHRNNHRPTICSNKADICDIAASQFRHRSQQYEPLLQNGLHHRSQTSAAPEFYARCEKCMTPYHALAMRNSQNSYKEGTCPKCCLPNCFPRNPAETHPDTHQESDELTLPALSPSSWIICSGHKRYEVVGNQDRNGIDLPYKRVVLIHRRSVSKPETHPCNQNVTNPGDLNGDRRSEDSSDTESYELNAQGSRASAHELQSLPHQQLMTSNRRDRYIESERNELNTGSIAACREAADVSRTEKDCILNRPSSASGIRSLPARDASCRSHRNKVICVSRNPNYISAVTNLKPSPNDKLCYANPDNKQGIYSLDNNCETSSCVGTSAISARETNESVAMTTTNSMYLQRQPLVESDAGKAAICKTPGDSSSCQLVESAKYETIFGQRSNARTSCTDSIRDRQRRCNDNDRRYQTTEINHGRTAYNDKESDTPADSRGGVPRDAESPYSATTPQRRSKLIINPQNDVSKPQSHANTPDTDGGESVHRERKYDVAQSQSCSNSLFSARNLFNCDKDYSIENSADVTHMKPFNFTVRKAESNVEGIINSEHSSLDSFLHDKEHCSPSEAEFRENCFEKKEETSSRGAVRQSATTMTLNHPVNMSAKTSHCITCGQANNCSDKVSRTSSTRTPQSTGASGVLDNHEPKNITLYSNSLPNDPSERFQSLTRAVENVASSQHDCNLSQHGTHKADKSSSDLYSLAVNGHLRNDTFEHREAHDSVTMQDTSGSSISKESVLLDSYTAKQTNPQRLRTCNRYKQAIAKNDEKSQREAHAGDERSSITAGMKEGEALERTASEKPTKKKRLPQKAVEVLIGTNGRQSGCDDMLQLVACEKNASSVKCLPSDQKASYGTFQEGEHACQRATEQDSKPSLRGMFQLKTRGMRFFFDSIDDINVIRRSWRHQTDATSRSLNSNPGSASTARTAWLRSSVNSLSSSSKIAEVVSSSATAELKSKQCRRLPGNAGRCQQRPHKLKRCPECHFHLNDDEKDCSEHVRDDDDLGPEGSVEVIVAVHQDFFNGEHKRPFLF